MRTNRLLVVPLLLAIALMVIGTLQYRWLHRVSEAERQRMHRNLEFACETSGRRDIDAVSFMRFSRPRTTTLYRFR